MGPRCPLCVWLVSVLASYGVRGPLGHQDDSVELHAIAHGDHDVAKLVVPGVTDRSEAGRSFAGVLRVEGLGRVFGAKAAAGGEEKGEERGGGAGFHGIPCSPYDPTLRCVARASGPSAVTRMSASATTPSVHDRICA